SQGYIVAAPSSYHEFTGPEPLAYDGPGTDKGNEWKITKVPYYSLPPLPSHTHAYLTTPETLRLRRRLHPLHRPPPLPPNMHRPNRRHRHVSRRAPRVPLRA